MGMNVASFVDYDKGNRGNSCLEARFSGEERGGVCEV